MGLRKINLNFWHGLIIASILLTLLQIRSCRIEKNYNKDLAEINSYKDTVLFYKAKNGEMIAYNKALKVSFDAFLDSYGDTIKNILDNIKIPKPDAVIMYRDRFYIDSIPSVPLNISNCVFDTSFNILNEYYEVKGDVSNKELLIRNIMIPNKVTVVTGSHRDKWWKQSEYITTISNSNPYIQSEGIQSFSFKDDKNRWSIGLSTGYGFYYDPWKGNVGHGITGGVSLSYKMIGWKKR